VGLEIIEQKREMEFLTKKRNRIYGIREFLRTLERFEILHHANVNKFSSQPEAYRMQIVTEHSVWK